MNHPIKSWGIAIPSLGVYTTLTKEPCGQWVNDFGTSGVMRMTYFGALNKKRIPRFDVSMASNAASNGGLASDGGKRQKMDAKGLEPRPRAMASGDKGEGLVEEPNDQLPRAPGL